MKTPSGLLIASRTLALKRQSKAANLQRIAPLKYMTSVDTHGTLRINLAELRRAFEDSLDRLRADLGQLRTGRVSPAFIEGICATIGNKPIPVASLGNVTNKDSQTLVIHMQDPSITKSAISAIQSSPRDFTVSSEPGRIVISIPKYD